jgi:glycerophosphoryl diester phosphodiesterase
MAVTINKITGDWMPSETHILHEAPITLIHHAANCSHHHPSGSLSALVHCLSAGAKYIEIDVIPLADGSFALLHDQHLEAATDGKGLAPQMTRAQVSRLHYKVDGQVTDEPVGFLEDAIDLLRQHPHTQRLQLDLKPFSLLTEPTLQSFLQILHPVLERVQVTSVADWILRTLAQRVPGLALGFDPLLYLDIVEETPRPENIPPFRVGAYGLLDDHPLSAYQWGPPAEYFAERAESLLVQAPGGC